MRFVSSIFLPVVRLSLSVSFSVWAGVRATAVTALCCDAVVLVIALDKGITAVREILDIALLCENLQKVQKIGMHLATETVVQNLAAFGFGKIGRG